MRSDPLTKALLTAIQYSDQPMVLSDPHLPDNPIIALNPPFAAMTGYDPSNLLGRNCRLLQGRGTDPATARRIGDAVRRGQGCIEWIVNHRPGGAAYWNLLFVSPVRTAAGDIRYFLGNQLDITLGFPDWLGAVSFGHAHMTPEIEAEFHGLLGTILDGSTSDPAALTQIVAHARRLAEVSTKLEPGDRRPVPALDYATS